MSVGGKEKRPLYGRGLPPFKKQSHAGFPTLEKDSETDILVIGGGAAGLLCAYGLTLLGREAAVCEAAVTGGGSTAYAPPYILPDADVTLRGLARRYGKEEAKRAFSELTETVDTAKEAIRAVGGGCGFTRRDGFIFSEYDNGDALSEEYRLRKYSGFPCERLSRSDCEEIFSFYTRGGIYVPEGGAEINVPLFCEALAQYLSVKGVEIYEYSPVTELIRTGTGYSAVIDGGRAKIKASLAIDCRGRGQRLSLLKNASVYSAVTTPQEDFYGWKNRCIIKTFSSSPLVACTTEDGRLYLEGFPNKRLLGGLSAEYGFGRLERSAEKMFFGAKGDAPSIFYERVFSHSPDGLPYMGRAESDGRLYRVYASGRCGLTAALLASKLIPAAISGDKEAAKRLERYEIF